MSKYKLIILFFTICCSSSILAMDAVLQTGTEDASSDVDSVVVSDGVCNYLDTKINPEWSRQKSFDENFGFTFDNNMLYLFAFNTGQANCIILRKGKKVVIFDAGGEFVSESQSEKAIHLIEGTTVESVFITHPHADHFSLMSIFGQYLSENTRLYLGGKEDDWKDLLEKEGFCKNLANITFVGDLNFFCEKAYKDVVLLNDMVFRIFNGGVPSSERKNQKSFITKVIHKNTSVLFTGDAEGEGVDRHIGSFVNLRHIIKLMSISHGDDPLSFIKNYNSLLEDKSVKDEKVESFLEFYNSLNERMGRILPLFNEEEFKSIIYHVGGWYQPIREEIRSSQLVVVPHHGTNTEHSQRWIGYFSNDGLDHIFLINSFPFEKNHLPKRSSVEFVPESPLQLPHAIIYSQDEANIQSFRITKRPVYVTGAAPGGVECFCLLPENILKLDVARHDRYDNERYRWFDVFDMKRNSASPRNFIETHLSLESKTSRGRLKKRKRNEMANPKLKKRTRACKKSQGREN